MAEDIVAYQSELNSFGISLHRAILDQLAVKVEDAIEDGRIRSQDGKHSVYDFIREILQIKNPWRTWKGFQDVDGDLILRFCSIRFSDESQTKTTPVTDFVGLFYLAYMANCPFSQQLRQSSAILIAKERESDKPKSNRSSIAHLEKALEQSRSDHERYPQSIDHLQDVSGIVNKSQVKQAVLRDFIAGRDYTEIDSKIFVTNDVFNILVMSFKSMRGTDITQLPELIKIKTVEYFQYQERRRMNRRTGQRDSESPGQMPIEFA